MTLSSLLHHRRYLPYYGVLAAFFFLVGAYMEYGAGIREAQRISLEKENQILTAYKTAPAPESHRDFLETLFQGDSPESYAALLEDVGLTVTEIREKEMDEDSLGKFNKIQLQGSGTFSQIIRGFDIIQGKERWNRGDLIQLSRRGEDLLFTMEITTFQSRGTYEEEKYRAHRPHGDRKEQSR